MRPFRAETPHPDDLDLLAGHELRRGDSCWRPRGTPVPLLIHTRKGRAVVRYGRAGEQVISAGDTVLWRAGAAQDYRCSRDGEPWDIVWVHFRPRPHWRAWLSWPSLGPGVTWISTPQPRIQARVEAALLETVSVANSGSPGMRDFALNALERALLWLDAVNPGPGRLDGRLHEAVLFVASHLDTSLGVVQIAEAVQLSPSRLSHLFTEQIGVPPARFIEQRRIERAQGLLESSSLSVGAIAEITGFSSQFYFANRFRNMTGVSPTDWRRRRAGPIDRRLPTEALRLTAKVD